MRQLSLGGACRVIEVRQVEDCLQLVVNIVPLQGESIQQFASVCVYPEVISRGVLVVGTL